MTRAPRARLAAAVATVVLLAAGLAACGTSPGTTPPTTGATGGAGGTGTSTTAGTTGTVAHGTASVAYADSLQLLFASVLEKSFASVSGDTATGRADGSTTLAQEILSGEISPGVFMAVGKKAIKKLWTTRSHFLIQLATDPLVVAYNPKSKYAGLLAQIAAGHKPISSLFTLLAIPGVRVGRTDPNADPQGVYFVLMFELAQKALGLPSDPASTVLGVSSSQPFGSTSQEYASDALISDLQAGEFDVSSAYLTQAIQYKLPYISLPASLDFAVPSESSEYGTVSVTLTDGTVDKGDLVTLNTTLVQPASGSSAPSAADAAADDAFVAYLLSERGRADLEAGGYLVSAPVFTGATSADTPTTALPKSLAQAFTAAPGTIKTG